MLKFTLKIQRDMKKLQYCKNREKMIIENEGLNIIICRIDGDLSTISIIWEV